MRRRRHQHPRREAKPKDRAPSPPTSLGEWRRDRSVSASSNLGGIRPPVRRGTRPGYPSIPPAIGTAIDSLGGGRTLGHRNRVSLVNSSVYLRSDAAVDLLDAFLLENPTIEEKPFETRDRIVLRPFLLKRFRDVLRHIVRRMSGHSECLAFDETRAITLSGARDGVADRSMDRQDIAPVNRLARHSVGRSAHRDIFDGILFFRRRRVCIAIIVAYEIT